MNRINQKFAQLKRKRKKAFIAFITAGDPSLNITKDLVLSFDRTGVDIVELGVPFSDPMADGPTIQASSQRALNNNVTLNKIFSLVKEVRRTTEVPIVLMTYYNPVFHFGEKRFISAAVHAKVNRVIIPDLPPEEAKDFLRLARAKDFSVIFFLSPTTTPKRMKVIAKASSGFIYYVSLTGVTGARQILPGDYLKQVKAAKRLTKTPICVGFGVSSPQQVKQLSKVADGVIVGSAIINEINKSKNKKEICTRATRFVKKLKVAL